MAIYRGGLFVLMEDKKINFVFENWSSVMGDDLEKIGDGLLDWYCCEVLQSRLAAISVFAGSDRVGTVLFRVEDAEFVIVAGAGKPEFDGIAEIYPRLEAIAKALKCASIRTHTKRLGLIKKAEKQGYSISEFVLRKGL